MSTGVVTYRTADREGGVMAAVVEGRFVIDEPRLVIVDAADGRHIIPWHQLIEIFEEK